MKLNRNDIRFASASDLAALLNVYPQQVSAWVSGKPYLDSALDQACSRYGVSKAELVAGIELRRADYQERSTVRTRFSGVFSRS